jgi:hypothetical protein
VLLEAMRKSRAKSIEMQKKIDRLPDKLGKKICLAHANLQKIPDVNDDQNPSSYDKSIDKMGRTSYRPTSTTSRQSQPRTMGTKLLEVR